jgi:malate dehydrogenase (oxaloacetate-decarboxylating)
MLTDGMVIDAAYALAEYTAKRHPERLYPPVAELREVSEHVAARVVERAIEDGVSTLEARSSEAILALVRERAWKPAYVPYVAV